FRPRENARFVRIAIGSLGEAMTHLRHALRHRYISELEYQGLMRLAKRAHGAATGLVLYLDSCPPDRPAPADRQARHHRHSPRKEEPEP
ncbi:MAG TPA: four helix bundle protein, partial [Thermoanaerobaculia bacterium]|nr:four helix bundle protein [Thermoanaerobaculia bacterium]